MFSRRAPSAMLVVLLACAVTLAEDSDSSGVQSAVAPPEPIVQMPRRESGLQAKSQEALRWMDVNGVDAQISLVNDWSKNFRGGACSRGSVDRYLLKTSVSFDTQKISGWEGGTGFVSLYHRLGGQGS
jgi:hypothetical protein